MKSTKSKTTILELLAAGVPVTLATAAAGVARSTFYQWMQTDDRWRRDVDAAQVASVAPLIDRIRSAAEQGQWQAAAWLLERRWPSEFGRRDTTRIDTTPRRVPEWDTLTDEQLTRIAAGESPDTVLAH